MKTSLILTESATNSDDITTTISNANPNATDAQLYNAAVALSGLTTNTFVSVKRLDETLLSAPENGGVE